MRKAAIALSVVVLAAAFFYMTRDRSYDRSFDTRVANPAYPTAGGGPVVLYDEGHLNTHTTTTGYKPFADLVRNDGYAADDGPTLHPAAARRHRGARAGVKDVLRLTSHSTPP